jgi:hypothetical protein
MQQPTNCWSANEAVPPHMREKEDGTTGKKKFLVPGTNCAV